VKLNLTSYLNQTVSICIPAIDEQARPYKLLGIELYGLWLEGADPTGGLLTGTLDGDRAAPMTLTAFVPFAQIGCVVVGAVPAPDGSPADADRAAAATAPAAPAPGSSAGRRRGRRRAS
jgi:hypothetical protein